MKADDERKINFAVSSYLDSTYELKPDLYPNHHIYANISANLSAHLYANLSVIATNLTSGDANQISVERAAAVGVLLGTVWVKISDEQNFISVKNLPSTSSTFENLI